MAGAWKEPLWQQFGGAIDTLENAIVACPDELWADRSRRPEYWYVAFHTLFFLDFYLSKRAERFAPPAPFTLTELDPAGVLPDRPYSKGELLAYLQHGRRKCHAVIRAMTDQTLRSRRRFSTFDGSLAELLLHTMRHVQHHAAQLNLILRQQIDSAPGWVRRTRTPLFRESHRPRVGAPPAAKAVRRSRQTPAARRGTRR